MKKILVFIVSLISVLDVYSWAPMGEKIKTPWAEKVTPENVWQSYPRPQLQRSEWTNLNGLWSYAVTDMETVKKSVRFEGEILVPFAIESSLSGVQRTFLPTDKLWYSREFDYQTAWNGKEVILHFGAVDYECTVWLNNKLVGTHKGGNNPFQFDVTKQIRKGGKQLLELSVIDPTDMASISRGKQQLNQKGIWYTPVSGIWKTVWLEAVNKVHLTKVQPNADIHKKTVTLGLKSCGTNGSEMVKVVVLENGKILRTLEQKLSSSIEITLPEATLWTPSTPQLYDVEIQLYRGKQLLDEVRSYFTLREVSVKKDEMGYNRICLNGSPIFQYGTLDQGWWPDGLLTPPSEEAMLWDMIQLKEMGFNTIRKHIKVEPEIYYYYADSLGLMMWQDMVSGFATDRKEVEHIKPNAVADWNAPADHSAQWQEEMFEMIDQLGFYSCITTWVVFNEGWGQHNTAEIVNKVMAYDPSRIIDGVTGWTDRGVGQMYDVHNYPVSSMILPEYNGNRLSVLGEFGGYGLPIKGNLWNPNMRNWGYKNIEGGLDFLSNYGRVIFDLESLIAQGLAAAIYTQTTDVEGEVNGFITYDRKVTKLPVDLMRILHNRLYEVKAARSTLLIPDGQDGQKRMRMVAEAGKATSIELPAQIKGKRVVSSTYRFTAEKSFRTLSLWLNTSGNVKAWLNGTLIFSQSVKQTRQYNQYNLSDYADYLRVGENEFIVEVENKGANQINFDYGLRAF